MKRRHDAWTEVERPRVRIHDMFPFGFLDKIKGLGSYASRALVQNGIVYSGYEDPDSRRDIVENHNWLREIEVGASKLVLVRGSDLVGGILKEDKALGHLDNIRAAIKAGMPLDFYLSRGLEPFVQKLGIGWDQISTPPPVIAERFDDKYRLRCMGNNLRMHQAFSPWELVDAEFDAVMQARKRVLERSQKLISTDIVYLKVHDYDGGAGIMRLNADTPLQSLRDFLEEFNGHSLIIDAGYPEDVFDTEICSMKVLFHEGHWEPLFFSKMIIENNAHKGNVVAIGQDVVSEEVQNLAKMMFAPFNNEAAQGGYGNLVPRTACIDFLVVRYRGATHVFMLEYNARSSAADYAIAPCLEALQRFGCGKAAVWMENVNNLPAGLTLNQVRDEHFCGKPWDGTSEPGFLLINAGCLSSQGKVTALTLAPTIEEARCMFESLVPSKTGVRNLDHTTLARVRARA
jgi:hypothetical protein